MAECILLLARKEAVAEQTVAGEVVGEVEGVDPVYKAAEGLADELEATQAFSGGGGLEEEEDPPTQAFSGGRGEAEMEDTPTQAYSGGGGEAVGEVEEVEEQVVNTLTQASQGSWSLRWKAVPRPVPATACLSHQRHLEAPNPHLKHLLLPPP